MTTKATTLYCLDDPRYSLVIDPSQVFPDDPGAGTPAMVYGPKNASGSYGRVIDTEEMDTDRGGLLNVPGYVIDWLCDGEEVAEALATIGW